VRIDELVHSPLNTPESNLVTALELLRNRYKDVPTPPKLSTQSLINMVLNTDRTFDYDALVSANEENPAVKNLIKSYNKDYVELRPAGEDAEDEATTTNTPDGDPTQNPVDTVDDMAKRAAKTRGAPISNLN
jgi:hypothetical protein